jgi:hypothetical protein
VILVSETNLQQVSYVVLFVLNHCWEVMSILPVYFSGITPVDVTGLPDNFAHQHAIYDLRVQGVSRKT